ncbi:hypothetical protein B7494_g1396 [Chlorociboria aeruginascens]|nr:hypothetical protein B7494_g1396 [Chlorociboria aeruginascens]
MESNNFIDPSSLSGISGGPERLSGLDTGPFDDFSEEPLFSADWDQDTASYDGNLYSTPLNWDPPMPMPETKTEETAQPQYPALINTLTPAQQEKLRSIAMPQHLQYNNQQSPQSTTSTDPRNSTSSPENHSERSRKRKSSAEVDDDDDEDSNDPHPPVKKTTHNLIEKRYRTNLNDKIAALRDSVPSLRVMTKKNSRGEEMPHEDLQGLTPAHKLNKATVLSKATEYIRHLEKRNSRLQEENTSMKVRINAFEKLFLSGSLGLNPVSKANQYQYPQEYTNSPGTSTDAVAQGMIQVPDDMRRLHGQMSQQTYPVPQEHYQQNRQQIGSNGWGNGGGYFGKLMVGSLAGLMIMEGFSEAEQSGDKPSTRGLFALPTQLIGVLKRSIQSTMDFSVLGYHISASQTLGYVKIMLLVGALLAAFLPSLFKTKPKLKGLKTEVSSLAAAPSLASSIQVRRQAWLTAIQTVWVPRHNFFLEAAALCMKMVKLSVRNLVGSHGYTFLTGITEQQEAARTKAWDIALDAQLAGGDVEVSKSRLTLTLLASGTLPDTPTRLMLKSLHIRVLLWEVGNAGFNGFYMFQEIAAKLARWKWNEARELQRLIAHTKQQEEDGLPSYLLALLEQECDDVLVDAIGQRAYNLAWNLPKTHNTQRPIDGMDCVVDDLAIRSSLDAVAAWWSSLVLQRALAKSLESNDDDLSSQKCIVDDITLAIKTAPIGSGAQHRALVARAVLSKEKPETNIAAALQALRPSLLLSKSSNFTLPDIDLSLRCAMAIAHIDHFPTTAPEAALKLVNNIRPVNLTLLGFTAAFKLMEKVHAHKVLAVECARSLEILGGTLRRWIGGGDSEKSGLEREIKAAMVERCLNITKQAMGMEKDAGYESMNEHRPLRLPVPVSESSPQPRKRKLHLDVREEPTSKRRSPDRADERLKHIESISSTGATSSLIEEMANIGGPTLLKRTLGLQTDRYSQYIGPTTDFEPSLIDLSPFDPQDESLLSRGTLRKVSNMDTFLLLPDHNTPGHEHVVEDAETIENIIAPHGPALLELYFRIIHPNFPILQKAVFFEKYNRSYREFSPPILAAVYILAINWWDHSEELVNLARPDLRELERMARVTLTDAMYRPKLSTVQAGLLLSQRPEGDQWAPTAQLVAIGQELGLHLDCTNWKIPPWERGLRKRLAWALYMQDKWGSLVHGRPSHILASNWAVLPLSLNDFPDDEYDESDSEESAEYSHGRLLFIQMIVLSQILAEVLDTFYTLQAMATVTAAGPQGTQLVLQLAKPVQLKLKEWFTALPPCLRMDASATSPNAQKLSSTGYLHLSYFATEITLHRRIIRSLSPSPSSPPLDPYIQHICRSAAKTRLISAMDFVNRLNTSHLQSFWYFSSKTNFALIGTFGSLLWATSPGREEADWYRRRLGEYRWTLGVSAKGVGAGSGANGGRGRGLTEFAMGMLDTSTGLLNRLPEKPALSRAGNEGEELARKIRIFGSASGLGFGIGGRSDTSGIQGLEGDRSQEGEMDESGLVSPSTTSTSSSSESGGYEAFRGPVAMDTGMRRSVEGDY